jgi:hypothetical protein
MRRLLFSILGTATAVWAVLWCAPGSLGSSPEAAPVAERAEAVAPKPSIKVPPVPPKPSIKPPPVAPKPSIKPPPVAPKPSIKVPTPKPKPSIKPSVPAPKPSIKPSVPIPKPSIKPSIVPTPLPRPRATPTPTPTPSPRSAFLATLAAPTHERGTVLGAVAPETPSPWVEPAPQQHYLAAELPTTGAAEGALIGVPALALAGWAYLRSQRRGNRKP